MRGAGSKPETVQTDCNSAVTPVVACFAFTFTVNTIYMLRFVGIPPSNGVPSIQIHETNFFEARSLHVCGKSTRTVLYPYTVSWVAAFSSAAFLAAAGCCLLVSCLLGLTTVRLTTVRLTTGRRSTDRHTTGRLTSVRLTTGHLTTDRHTTGRLTSVRLIRLGRLTSVRLIRLGPA